MKAIPKFEDEDQERDYWADHDSAEAVNWSNGRQVTFPNLKRTNLSSAASSAILKAVHETATGLHWAGAMSQATLREFDQLCLSLVEPVEPECCSDDDTSPAGPR
jgi:hypothetical protein